MKRCVLALVVGGAITVAAPAHALVYTVTFYGTITAGWDADVFGGLGDLAGLRYQTSYRIEPTKAGAYFLFQPDGKYAYGETSGGKNSERYPGNPVTGAMTVNSITVRFGDYFGSAQEDSGFGPQHNPAQYLYYFSESFDEFEGGTETISSAHELYSRSAPFIDGNLLTGPRGYVRLDGQFVNVGSGFSYNRNDTTRAWANLMPEGFTVSTSVPEPPTWALTIAGFIFAGTTLRRRSRAQA